MATIKAIEGRTVHQIQSGQVIVDICSVVKELVENGLDAGATSIEVRFKGHGLDSVEVQDNGEGISPENYDTLALKHYTSKLSTYSDLSELQTFGFRGEALSSLCALSKFHVLTAKARDGSKGTKLEYETSGRLKSISVIASQKGTTIVVETLFNNLPVRRRELEKNIKREYTKALGVLNAYACISTGVKFVVSNVPPNGKKVVAFSTNLNTKTRDNIANVFGAKTLAALVPLDLEFDMEASSHGDVGLNSSRGDETKSVQIVGHISRPSWGEGRQTADRQMFFVNSRPCGLPQIAKVFNEVYKSYNISQSPFIFADIRLDTNAYDVNVSPDKRTILLHDQSALLENLRVSLTNLFDSQAQVVPQSSVSTQRLPAFKQLSLDSNIARSGPTLSEPSRTLSREPESSATEQSGSPPLSPAHETGLRSSGEGAQANNVLREYFSKQTKDRPRGTNLAAPVKALSSDRQRMSARLTAGKSDLQSDDTEDCVDDQLLEECSTDDGDLEPEQQDIEESQILKHSSSPVQDTTANLPRNSQNTPSRKSEEPMSAFHPLPLSSQPGAVQTAFDRMRPRRTAPEIATITVGSETSQSQIGSQVPKRRKVEDLVGSTRPSKTSRYQKNVKTKDFAHGLKSFAAPGTQAEEDSQEDLENDSDKSGEVEDLSENESAYNEDVEIHASQALKSNSERGLGDDDPSQSHESDAEKTQSESDSDDEYLDDDEKKAREEAKVAKLIKTAERKAMVPSEDSIKRADAVLNGSSRKKESTTQWTRNLEVSSSYITRLFKTLESTISKLQESPFQSTSTDPDVDTPEDGLSLTVSKSDFASMHIAGQFNLGFILATRSTSPSSNLPTDIFIIDQHASDEKYNFERLQATTIVQNQRLVQPLALSLTAIEEETILDYPTALEKNGFLISIDTSGSAPVGRRCHLRSLPMSKEVVFNSRDLEELLVLLADSPREANGGNSSSNNSTLDNSNNNKNTPFSSTPISRPSKVRKMFAMRACRSSIMIGRTLTQAQMQGVVRRMGELEKPWNCPHGRPTMRHVVGLKDWDCWDGDFGEGKIDWAAYS